MATLSPRIPHGLKDQVLAPFCADVRFGQFAKNAKKPQINGLGGAAAGDRTLDLSLTKAGVTVFNALFLQEIVQAKQYHRATTVFGKVLN